MKTIKLIARLLDDITGPDYLYNPWRDYSRCAGTAERFQRRLWVAYIRKRDGVRYDYANFHLNAWATQIPHEHTVR